MSSKNNSTRMTLRLPNDIRGSLDSLVQDGTADSITAAIIERLRKSLLTEPVNKDTYLDLLKQKSSEMQELILRLEQPQSTIPSREQAIAQLNNKEQRLLHGFACLNEKQKDVLLESFLPLVAELSSRD